MSVPLSRRSVRQLSSRLLLLFCLRSRVRCALDLLLAAVARPDEELNASAVADAAAAAAGGAASPGGGPTSYSPAGATSQATSLDASVATSIGISVTFTHNKLSKSIQYIKN